jgi:YidC/Oxa1 family membrane protein insertase
MGGSAGRYANVSRPAVFVDDDFEQVDDLEDGVGAGMAFNGEPSWLGITDRYFLAALVPNDSGGRVVVQTTETYGGSYYLFENSELRTGDAFTGSFDVYAGPKDLERLEEAGSGLDKAVRFGWFGFFARILLTLLEMFHSVVGNWGLSIIALTLFVKALFFPLTQKAFLSAKKMQALQPQLKEIREKYADNKELQSRETMEMFKAHEVNPLGGCLPTLIQLPVWIALYNVLLFSVQLYHTEFLYLKDLSAPDPTGIMPVVVGILMFFQQRMTPMTGMDPMQAKMMRLMPLIFVVFIFSFPSGLAVYIFMNSGLTVIQQWFIHRNYDREHGAAAAPGKTA